MKLHLTNAEVGLRPVGAIGACAPEGMWNAEGWSRCAPSLLLNKDAVLFEDLAPLRSHMKLHYKSFFFDQTGRFSGQRRRSYETSFT